MTDSQYSDLNLDAIEARIKASMDGGNAADYYDVPALIAALREARTAINAFRNCCGNALEVCPSCNAAFAALGYTLSSEENPNA